MDIKSASWYMKYQPKQLDDLVFDSEDHKKLVTSWINEGRVPGNVLMSGKAGLGKTATAEILINSIIKAQNDLFKSKRRNIDEIRTEIIPFVRKKPVKSKQKIVYIEEVDKLHPDAQNELKQDVLEKYQENTIFICCTNFPKKIENALLTRMTYKITFSGNNIDAITDRLDNILKQESAQFDSTELKKYVQNNIKAGIRELINMLQIQYISNNGIIDFKQLSEQVGIEENVVKLMMNILGTLMSTDIRQRQFCYVNPLNSPIAQDYEQLFTLLHNNQYGLNYDLIFERFYEMCTFLPMQDICIKYAETIEGKKYPHAHVLGCLKELMQSAIDITG